MLMMAYSSSIHNLMGASPVTVMLGMNLRMKKIREILSNIVGIEKESI